MVDWSSLFIRLLQKTLSLDQYVCSSCSFLSDMIWTMPLRQQLSGPLFVKIGSINEDGLAHVVLSRSFESRSFCGIIVGGIDSCNRCLSYLC